MNLKNGNNMVLALVLAAAMLMTGCAGAYVPADPGAQSAAQTKDDSGETDKVEETAKEAEEAAKEVEGLSGQIQMMTRDSLLPAPEDESDILAIKPSVPEIKIPRMISKKRSQRTVLSYQTVPAVNFMRYTRVTATDRSRALLP